MHLQTCNVGVKVLPEFGNTVKLFAQGIDGLERTVEGLEIVYDLFHVLVSKQRSTWLLQIQQLTTVISPSRRSRCCSKYDLDWSAMARVGGLDSWETRQYLLGSTFTPAPHTIIVHVISR